MCVHLLTNASVLNSVPTFQNAVFNIHSLGKVLPIVEWVFIFIPILFHAIFGVIIIRGGLPNHSTYRLGGNFRYSLQRASGMIAFAFIMWHVFHMPLVYIMFAIVAAHVAITLYMGYVPFMD